MAAIIPSGTLNRMSHSPSGSDVATHATAAHTMSPGLIVLLLSLLLGMQPLTTDMYLPALPALTQGFGATLSQAQLTLTALLLAALPAVRCSSQPCGRVALLRFGYGHKVTPRAALRRKHRSRASP